MKKSFRLVGNKNQRRFMAHYDSFHPEKMNVVADNIQPATSFERKANLNPFEIPQLAGTLSSIYRPGWTHPLLVLESGIVDSARKRKYAEDSLPITGKAIAELCRSLSINEKLNFFLGRRKLLMADTSSGFKIKNAK